MESKDLMIGDWVSLSEVSGDIRRSIVVALDVDELRVRQPQDKGCDIVGYDMITPIPLTPEILEKNGFDVGTLCSVFKDEEGRIEIYIRRFELDITKGWYTEDEETFSLPPVYYVHQYQHSLRLCGLTELADNFQLPELPKEDTK